MALKYNSNIRPVQPAQATACVMYCLIRTLLGQKGSQKGENRFLTSQKGSQNGDFFLTISLLGK